MAFIRNATNEYNAGYLSGGLQQAADGAALNNLAGNAIQAAPPPRTIATALSSMDALVERLASMRTALGHLCEMIGGPYPACDSPKRVEPPTSGAVGRLNENAASAHAIMSEIDQLLSTIARSLG